jgi:pyruvate dehydrogenase E1 component alpha subunit
LAIRSARGFDPNGSAGRARVAAGAGTDPGRRGERLSPMTDTEHAARLYRSLRRIRRVEEHIARIYATDCIKSPVHLSIGQEAVAVGACDPLRRDDVIAITYRGHAAYLAKGGSLDAMMAELYGKSTGCGEGKAGSMHLVDMAAGVLGASAVVGTTIPLGVGFALAFRRRSEDRVAVVFHGDGAIEEGVFAESLNFAALHRLPVLFVMENNGYAIHSPIAKRWSTDRVCERVETYGVPARRISAGGVHEIREGAASAIAAMRRGFGPHFIECPTYRWREHVGPLEDYDAGYRDRRELAPWVERDPVAEAGAELERALRERIDREVEAEIARAVDFAERSPFPDPSRLWTDVYAD